MKTKTVANCTDSATWHCTMPAVVCPYFNRCSDANVQCGSCRNNQAKRSFYQPDPWWWSWYPQPYQRWITWTTSCGDTSGSTSYYAAN